MKAFRFSLEAILTLREQAEKAVQVRCAQAYAAERRAADNLREAEAALATAEQAQTVLLQKGCAAAQVEQLRSYSLFLEARRLEFMRAHEESKKRAVDAQAQLITATQKREALERLKNRQRIAHSYNAARLEQLTLDELTGGGALTENLARTFQQL